jgi:hypothetical protein
MAGSRAIVSGQVSGSAVAVEEPVEDALIYTSHYRIRVEEIERLAADSELIGPPLSAGSELEVVERFPRAEEPSVPALLAKAARTSATFVLAVQPHPVSKTSRWVVLGAWSRSGDVIEFWGWGTDAFGHDFDRFAKELGRGADEQLLLDWFGAEVRAREAGTGDSRFTLAYTTDHTTARGRSGKHGSAVRGLQHDEVSPSVAAGFRRSGCTSSSTRVRTRC